jgi:Rrf2 family protein
MGENPGMRVSAKVDYAVRAAVELAAAGGDLVKGEQLSEAQGIPLKFLENILIELRQAGIVRSQRGPEGGYWLGRSAAEVSVADVIRAVEGPLATVRGERPESLDYRGSAESLQRVWIALRGSMRDVLETVTLWDLAKGSLPPAIEKRAKDPDAWSPTESRLGARSR